jgi:hypothetical protein
VAGGTARLTRADPALRAELLAFLARVGADWGILFGSRVRGEELEGGDLDLVVGRRFAGIPLVRRLALLQPAWRLPQYLDAPPYTPEQWRRRRRTGGVLQAAAAEGLRLRPSLGPGQGADEGSGGVDE